MEGQRYWVPHEQGVWVPGLLMGYDTYSTDMGEVKMPAGSTPELISDKASLEGVDDCCLLSSISDASILHTLRLRYARDQIYTYVSVILVSVNPFHPVNIYSSDVIQQYHSMQSINSLPPHIFGITSLAFKQLVDGSKCQSMLISGESGAGKTENTKFVLLYISENLRSKAGLSDRLLEVNPILESFGNAKTVRNDNSSRFGKWIEIMVNPATMGLAGATITDYLLEVTRVCSQGPDERNYHIFYQLCTDAAKEAFPDLKITSPKDFAFLKPDTAKVGGIDDAREFQQLRDALAAMKITPDEEVCIFKIVAGILHLGNLTFEDQKVEMATGSRVQNEGVLSTAAEILGCNAEGLSKAVCFKRLTTGREVMMSPLDAEKAVNQRNSIVKMIYNRLFKFLVARCNQALGENLSSGMEASSNNLFFGVLDIAGFEAFDMNFLEQLFINLSNEKLQQFFNQSVFKRELAEYMEEGIPITHVTYQDNADTLALIEGTGGILMMLDDATMGVRQTDLQYTTKLLQQHDKNPTFYRPKFVKDKPLQFGIRHYAGEVTYTTEAWLEKNVSTQPPEVVELMEGSQLGVLQELAKDPDEQKGSTPGAKAKKPTVGAMFRKSLALLIEKLNNTEAHFVRCIKPNKSKKAGVFEAPLVMDQLRFCGVMETVKIRKAGFAARPTCLEFIKRFMVVIDKAERKQLLTLAGSKQDWFPSKETNLAQASQDLIKALTKLVADFTPEEIALGKTKVFIKTRLYQALEEARLRAFVAPTLTIQRVWRGHRTRVIMKEVLEVNNALKAHTAEVGGVDDSSPHIMANMPRQLIRRATVAETSLQNMDVLLEKALNLPIKLPSLATYQKARAKVAARAELARQLQNCNQSLDLTEIQAHVARAEAFNIAGELVDSLKTRSQTLEVQLPLRRALQNCVFSDVLEDVQKLIAQAEAAGLSGEEPWILPDGFAAWQNAVQRKDALVKEQKEREVAVAGLEQQIRSLASTVDLLSMQALLFRSMSYNMRGELVEALTKFEAAAREFKQFEGESEQAHEGTPTSKEEVEKEMAEAQQACDLPAMKAILHRCKHSKLPQDFTDDVRLRCDRLEKQTLLRRELQSVAVSQEYAAVQQALDTAIGLGVDRPEQWLLADGPSLLARAQTQCDELRRIETLKSMMTSAAESFDTKVLEKALSEASELGVPTADCTEPLAVFLSLQNWRFVESKSMEIRDLGGSDPNMLLKVSNLADQLQRLGLKVDTAGMNELAYEMAQDKRGPNRKKANAGKSAFDSADAKEREVAQKVYEDLTNFSKLRDPLTWGRKGLGDADEEQEVEVDPILQREAMLQHSPERIREPLTVLPAELDPLAVNCFLDILRYCGDKPDNFLGDKMDPIIQVAKKGRDLADEVFVQVMKQIKQNPSTRSSHNAWLLLQRLVQEAQPSFELGEFLRCFLQGKAEANPDELRERSFERPRGKSACVEAELRTRDASMMWETFQTSLEPSLAAETLQLLLAKNSS